METEAFVEKIEKVKLPVRIAILVVTLALIVGLFIGLIYRPKTQEIARTNKNIKSLETKLNRAKLTAKDFTKFKKDLAQVDAEFKEALRLLPNKKEIPTLLRAITELGTDSQLEFRLFRPQKERKKEFYLEIPVSIEVSGNYHDVAVFFDKVGRMDRIINILNVSMKPVSERATKLVTTCDAVTYSFLRTDNGVKTK